MMVVRVDWPSHNGIKPNVTDLPRRMRHTAEAAGVSPCSARQPADLPDISWLIGLNDPEPSRQTHLVTFSGEWGKRVVQGSCNGGLSGIPDGELGCPGAEEGLDCGGSVSEHGCRA